MTMREIADGAVRYWPLLVAGVGGIAGVALAADKILTLEESVKAQQTQAQEIQRIQVDQAVTREKIEALTDDAKANQALLLQILQKVK
mgnify:CR=1 FL=1